MYKAPSFGLGMKKDLRESIESVYNINNTINEEEQLIISLFEEFLEENFHVEMFTEEDLDYVFENEFPQWLEEKNWFNSLFGGGSEEKKQNRPLKKKDSNRSLSHPSMLARLTPEERNAARKIEYKKWLKEKQALAKSGNNNSNQPSSLQQAIRDADARAQEIEKQQKNTKLMTKGLNDGSSAFAGRSRQSSGGSGDSNNITPPASTASSRKVRSKRTGGSELGRKLMEIGTKVRANSNTSAGRRKRELLNKYKGQKNNNWRSSVFTSEN